MVSTSAARSAVAAEVAAVRRAGREVEQAADDGVELGRHRAGEDRALGGVHDLAQAARSRPVKSA